MDKKTYSTLLKDPRWQKRRLEILQRDEWRCQSCLDSEATLHVHHRWYEDGKKPWEYDDDALVTLCEACHDEEYKNRRHEESTLARALQMKGWWWSEVNDLAVALYEFPRKIDAEASALCWAIRDRTMQAIIWCLYFKRLGAGPEAVAEALRLCESIPERKRDEVAGAE